MNNNLIICALLAIFSVSSTTNRITRQTTQCGRYTFKCKDGSCISQTKLCDGKVDCPDRSDETSVACSKQDCYEFAFRCNYGACVDGKAPCNGIVECADKSDELLPHCPGVRVNSSSCGPTEFACYSGQCIDQFSLCDGRADCTDASDESVTECRDIDCASGFRCAYGGCISSELACNGRNDCADGSDEAPDLCDTTASVTPAGGARPVTLVGCPLPGKPTHGTYTVNSRTDFSPGEKVSSNTVLQYTCERNYFVDSDSVIVCLGTGWNKKIPDCIKTCPPLTSTSLDITCANGDRRVSCASPMLVGTVAKFSCKQFYIRPNPINTDTIVCLESGEWDQSLSAIKCGPECGRQTAVGTALSINGKLAKVGQYPWQVGVYLDYGVLIQKCGGTIINTKIVLTAAHCFVDSANAEVWAVGAGKIHRAYNTSEDRFAQLSKVSRIYVHKQYKGLQLNHAYDIAIMIVATPFVITGIVQNVCIDWSNEYEKVQERDGVMAYVAGWGRTAENGNPSDELRYLEMPYINKDKCFDVAPIMFRPFLTDDKICAGYVNQGKSLCTGDSGGGLTFVTQARHFIRGIVSVGPDKDGDCDSNQIAAFTSVSKHLKWIRSIEVLNKDDF